MSVALPNGSTIAIASAYGTGFTVSAISNANPGIATFSGSHGVITGDFFEITSGWSRMTNKILKAGTVATNDVTLVGQDTSSTSIYPASGGAGTGREITTWTQIAQVLTSQSQGGEQQFLTYQFLESDAEKRIPTTKSAGGWNITIADDSTQAGYTELVKANDDRLPRALKVTLPSGAVLVYNAYVSINKTPTLTVNEIMANEVTFSFLAEPERY